MHNRTVQLLAAIALAAFSSVASSVPAAAQADGSASLRSPDPEAVAAWYRDRLGFRLIADRNSVQGRHIVMERGGMLLEVEEVEPRPRPADIDATAATEKRVGLRILVADVDAELERLGASGVPIASSPDDSLDGRFRIAAIRDPEGRAVELREPLAGRTGEAP